MTITWYKDKKVIKESKNYKMVSDSKSATLKIMECSSALSGTYTVEVASASGKEESSATLTVKGPL